MTFPMHHLFLVLLFPLDVRLELVEVVHGFHVLQFTVITVIVSLVASLLRRYFNANIALIFAKEQ